MAYRGFYETAGGSGNFVPARAGLDPVMSIQGAELLRVTTDFAESELRAQST